MEDNQRNLRKNPGFLSEVNDVFYAAGVAQGQIMGIELKRVFEGLESGTSCRLSDFNNVKCMKCQRDLTLHQSKLNQLFQ